MNVSMNAAESIGRTLARLGHITAKPVSTEPDTSRDNIFRIVQEADAPLSVEDISQLTNLHVNTIRTHLDVLRAAGRVERTRESINGRGRPKWLYAATTEEQDAYFRLADLLGETLDQTRREGLAEEAATRWRSSGAVINEPAASPDEALAVAADALSRLGFDVEVSPVGDAVYLGNCPYASLVHEHPVICDIHARALEQVLDATGQDISLESMDVFPRPGVCVAHLRRRDTTPDWTVPGKSAAESKPATRKKKSRRTA